MDKVGSTVETTQNDAICNLVSWFVFRSSVLISPNTKIRVRRLAVTEYCVHVFLNDTVD